MGAFTKKVLFVTTPRVVHKSGSIDKRLFLSSDLVQILWIDIDENLLSSL